MRTISIRDLSGPTLAEAAATGKPVGVTNAGELCGVLIPVTRRWVETLVEENLSRILRSIELAEKEREVIPLDSVPVDEQMSDGAASRRAATASLRTSTLRTVAIRELNGTVIAEAAATQQALGITNANALAAVLLPVTRRWVSQLVDQNLSRILHSIELAEKEAAVEPPHLLDDAKQDARLTTAS